LGVNSRASTLSFAPEEHDKDHAHHSQKWRYQFHPRIPLHRPLGPANATMASSVRVHK
jgi:hypothetical protein